MTTIATPPTTPTSTVITAPNSMVIETTPTVPPKPGYLTTEFWLTLLAMGITTLYASGAITSDASNLGKAIALVAGVLTTLGYSVTRAKVKAAA